MSARAGIGRCDFNLTLINASNVEAAASSLPNQRHVPLMKTDFADNVAVNWHRDSTLEPFSTIAVYNHTPSDLGDSWRIAMGPYDGNCAPKLSVGLEDNDCYFMLGNFNHHHVHAVLAAKSTRFASTHRVALETNATYQHILSKANEAVKRATGLASFEASAIRTVGETLNAIEFDWIRQFYVQGSVHEVSRLLHVAFELSIQNTYVYHLFHYRYMIIQSCEQF